MTPQQIEYVLLLAELRSFSAAAKKLYITQPSFSKYIINIENQLGTPLFDRSTTPISLTPAGLAYVETAKQIRAATEELNNRLADMEQLRRGTLTIGASTFRTCYLLSASVSQYCSRYEGVSVSMVDDTMDQLQEMLKLGEIDLLIGTGAFDRKWFDVEVLAAEHLYFAVPPAHPVNAALAAYRLCAEDIKSQSTRLLEIAPAPLAHLETLPFVLPQQGEFNETALTARFAEVPFRPETALRVRTPEAAFAFVNAGYGASVIPDTMITFGNFAVHPAYYAMDAKLSESRICLVTRRNSYISQAALEYCLTLKRLVDIGTWRLG